MALALIPQTQFLTRERVADIVGVASSFPKGIAIIKRGDDMAPLVCLVASSTDKRYSDMTIAQEPNIVKYSFREQEVTSLGVPYKHPKPYEIFGPSYDNATLYKQLQKYQELQVVLCFKHTPNKWTICPDPFMVRGGQWDSVTKKGHYILYKPKATRGLLNLNHQRILQIQEDVEEED